MNIPRRPIYEKPAKVGPNLAYLALVRQLPCCVCERFGMRQMSPTAAHHPIHGRYGNEKVPDTDAIPLCEGHHQGSWDTSKIAIHRGQESWEAAYGPDTDYVAATRERVGL